MKSSGRRVSRGLAWILCGLLWVGPGCGHDAPDQPSPATSSPEGSSSPTPAAPPAEAPAGQPSVDLLKAVRTDLSVSSAYHDEPEQARRLVDGDLATAWNSRTGELVGAAIEVRLPVEVEVESIAMTAGYTRRGEGTDLFTGNHRIRKVAVSRDGTELGRFDLDVESRELSELPVHGPGGVYRVEVVELLPGSRSDWREVVVSELEVRGHAPGAEPGKHRPRVSVGGLPEARPAADDPKVVEARAALTELLPWYREHAWPALRRATRVMADAVYEGAEERDVAAVRRARSGVFRHVAGAVRTVSPEAAQRLTRAAGWEAPAEDLRWRSEDLMELEQGVGTLVDWVDDADSRCRWTEVAAGLRLQQAALELRLLKEEVLTGGGEPEDGAIIVAADDLRPIAAAWAEDPRAQAHALLSNERWTHPAGAMGWDEVLRWVRAVEPACR